MNSWKKWLNLHLASQPSTGVHTLAWVELLITNYVYIPGLCLDLDPDVIAALDEDFDFNDPDNQLEDNFIDLADGNLKL